jgi:type IV pilus assembly protein PilW
MNSLLQIRDRQAGLSLIELLVAMAIGLVVTLATSTVLLNFEGNKRKMTSVNDVNQTGAYITYVLDRALRSAGSSFASRGVSAFGCSINASRDGVAILPSPGALPAPFAGLNTNFRLAPVIIYPGQSEAGSDVLAYMKGSHGFGESPSMVISGSITSNDLRLQNTLGWRNNDIALVIQQNSGCMVQQVGGPGFAGSTNQTLPFTGRYFNAAGTNMDLTAYGAGGANTYVAAIGNAEDNRPEFQVVGVGADNVLSSFDLLRFDGAATAPQVIADGVVEMRALYGIDINSDGVLDRWISPTAAGYTPASLLAGTPTARVTLRTIVAIRLGLILRTSTVEKEAVNAPTVSLFSDLGALAYALNLSGDEQLIRHRTVEVTIPLRNVAANHPNQDPTDQ